MILNSCLTVIEKRVDGVFAANSHVIAAWFPPSSTINPMQHLPENAANLQRLLLPVCEPETLLRSCALGLGQVLVWMMSRPTKTRVLEQLWGVCFDGLNKRGRKTARGDGRKRQCRMKRL
ncbi:hypothetical protein CgunFtcFv8_003867 [Champsocephalus gunnari]|uniref:Uncharacterized protein n=1 Tax=Champsocephalus gunnari TaxID=52237 RepID=A0AAN8HY69_CHAGU|nr:hypothetical protein CgunFtcFv8_003857 [Champsocephalus gunnari]KAK5932137.1 hypothetical protein CgunFtcFv8_003867 [Champsocephalus gunnari]